MALQDSAPRPEPAAPGERGKLTPETWIQAATQVLVDQGIDHVRVDTLAKTLGVSRGSFYWHFKDRDALLRGVLQAWIDQVTTALTRRLVNAAQNPQTRLRDLISLPHRGRAAVRTARIELAIRAWARRDTIARQAVDAADSSRIAYHEEVFRELGFTGADARARAFVTYGYEVAESVLNQSETTAERQQRQQFFEALILRKP
jgi:AcrR family transcriptional regulator